MSELIPDGTEVICKGTIAGVPAGTPAIVRHRTPGGFDNLPLLYWLELDGHPEIKGYWGSAAEFAVKEVRGL